MTNRPHRGRQGGPRRPRGQTVPGGISMDIPEPEVRRWPHPVTGDLPEQLPEPALHYIRCALSYQNQLLADIKALLEQMAEQPEESSPS